MSHVVVVGTDYSSASTLAVDTALRLCALRPDAVVHVLHAARAQGGLVELDAGNGVRHVPVDEATAHLASVTNAQVAALGRVGVKLEPAQVWNHIRMGPASTAVVAFAAEQQADLVVVGTRGRRGVSRLLLGSVAEDVVRRAGCTVLVVRAKQYEEA